MTSHDESHIIRTSPRRMLKGLAFLLIPMAILGYVCVAFWDYTANYPPPVSAPPPAPPVEQASTAGGGGATAPATSATGPAITIPTGAATPGNPPYTPTELSVKKGETVTVTNSDNAPHTVTNGVDASDPNVGKSFDTSLIMAGASAKIDTSTMEPGEYPFHCTVHPFMKGKLTVTA